MYCIPEVKQESGIFKNLELLGRSVASMETLIRDLMRVKEFKLYLLLSISCDKPEEVIL